MAIDNINCGESVQKLVDVTNELVDTVNNTEGSDFVNVTSLDDLPTPVGDVITLADDGVNYRWSGAVDIGVNRLLITGDNIKFYATNPATDGFISSNTGSVIECNKSLSIDNLFIVGSSSTNIIKMVGTGVEVLTLERVTLIGGAQQIDITNLDISAFSFCLFSSCVDGILAQGTNNRSFLVDRCLFRTITGTAIDLNGAEFLSVGIDYCTCTNEATTNFLEISPNSGNIKAGGEGTITNCKVDLNAGGTSSVGYSPLNLLWFSSGNNSILTSDRLLPAGWETASDGEITVPTLAVSTTPVKLLIDGEGSSSNKDYLPLAIRGIGSLWDRVNSCVKPIVVGDSYDMRVSVGIQSLSGNPNEITLSFDIGGGAAPSIVIAEDTKAIKGLTQPVIYSFPIFDLTTFFNNGGQIFLNVDQGTATISSRNIFLIRTSSGAS